ncbi:hypothetical protein LINPERHAP2_LOCUS3390, partial [Linum perenne]
SKYIKSPYENQPVKRIRCTPIVERKGVEVQTLVSTKEVEQPTSMARNEVQQPASVAQQMIVDKMEAFNDDIWADREKSEVLISYMWREDL